MCVGQVAGEAKDIRPPPDIGVRIIEFATIFKFLHCMHIFSSAIIHERKKMFLKHAIATRHSRLKHLPFF